MGKLYSYDSTYKGRVQESKKKQPRAAPLSTHQPPSSPNGRALRRPCSPNRREKPLHLCMGREAAFLIWGRGREDLAAYIHSHPPVARGHSTWN